jgi:hypothetical protein
MNQFTSRTNSLQLDQSAKLPNFLIIGAAKSGTSSLWKYLRQHPDLYMPINKEPNFFAFEGQKLNFHGPKDDNIIYDKLYKYSITDFSDYCELFSEVEQESALGEASVRYLYLPQAAEQIQKYLPDAKLIVILRNPIERLYSHYLMNVGMYGLEPLPIEEAIAQELNRKSAGWGWDWHYVSVGLYYEQLKRYYDRFQPAQIKVFLYEELCRDTLNIVQEIYTYLEIDPTFIPNISQQEKKAYWPKNRLLHNFLTEPNRPRSWMQRLLPENRYQALVKQMSRMNSQPIPPLNEHLQKHLKDLFRPDIEKLQELIDQDLSDWLESDLSREA